MNVNKIYTPNQILISSIFFGPFVSAYCLDKNFKALNKVNKSVSIALYLLGLLITISLCFVPSGKIFIYLTYSFTAHYVADRKQISQKEMNKSDDYRAHSIFNLLTVSILALVAVLAVVFVTVFSMTIIERFLS
jgi:hypothetical protein